MRGRPGAVQVREKRFSERSMDPYKLLLGMPEQVPDWLGNLHNGNAFERQAFFASRVVYYPGSGTDGHPVKLFGSTHCAHCFVYADYGITQASLEADFGHAARGFLGYHTLARLNLTESDLTPG